MVKYTIALAVLFVFFRIHFETKYQEQRRWYFRYQIEFVNDSALQRNYEKNARFSNLFRILATLMILITLISIMQASDG